MKCPKCQHENPDDSTFCGKCATKLGDEAQPSFTKTIETPTEELATGSIFANRYQVIEELGKGGMGKVYRVLDKKLNEQVALKLIKPEIASDKKTLERFKNELKLARKVSQKNVGRMFDLGEETGTHYITMEYVPGEDLKSFIKRVGQIPVGKSLSIAKQLCEGLSEAHGIGIVHRDLKPSNIMIDKQGNARIMDFGIARSMEAKKLTGAGVIIGTPEYMSPEQVEGKETDQRSDIYSLGVILYEMLTGRLPFEGDTPLSIAVQHRSDTPKDPAEFNPQIPEDLSATILKCLEKEREKRYKNTQEIYAELTQIENGMPTTEREAGKKKPLTSKEITMTFSVKRLTIPVLGAIALIIIGLVIWRPWRKWMPVTISTDMPSIAVLYFQNLSGDESLNTWRAGLAYSFITDLEQSKHLNVLGDDKINETLRSLNLDDVEGYSTSDLLRVARKCRVSHIITGTFNEAGEEYTVTASLKKVDLGEIGTIWSDSFTGIGEESLNDSVDELTKEIKSELDLTEEQISGDFDEDLDQILTPSPEAYKHFQRGIELRNQGRYRDSILSFRDAVDLDPEFAMAYRHLALAHYGLGEIPQRVKYLEKAMEYEDRLSEKNRYVVRGNYYSSFEETFDKALETYQTLVMHYPNDMQANGNLAVGYLDLGQVEEAIPYFEKAIEAGSIHGPTFANLASCYRAVGENDKAEEILKNYLENIREDAYIHLLLARHFLRTGRYDLSMIEADKALELDPSHLLSINNKALVYRSQNDLIKAESTYKKLMELTEPSAAYYAHYGLCALDLLWGKYDRAKTLLTSSANRAGDLNFKWVESDMRSDLAYIHIQTGDLEDALRECEEALESAAQAGGEKLSRTRNAMHRKGLAQLANQSMAEAQKTAEELREFIETGLLKNEIRLYYHLMGRIKLESKEYSEAIDLLQQALNLTPDIPEFIDSLAQAYFLSGDLTKAKTQYEKLISLTPGVFFGDLYSKSFYMLGQIFEKQGAVSKAIESYEKFLDLWKDADPGLPELDEARKRLAELR